MHPKLILGSAQFANNYGYNKKYISNYFKVKKILQCLKKGLVNHIDTAHDYGNSEKYIGDFFCNKKFKPKIITKFKFGKDEINEINNEILDKKINLSLRKLKIKNIEVFLFHKFSDYIMLKKKSKNIINEFKKNKKIKYLGVSVYTPSEAYECLGDNKINFLEIPFNILDTRWLNAFFLKKIKLRKDLKILIRSVFLKGVILKPSNFWPKKIKEKNKIISDLENVKKKYFYKNKLEMCLDYIKNFKWIYGVIIGVRDENQFKEIIRIFRNRKKKINTSLIIKKFKRYNKSNILNPQKW